jgi:hypothetical protein
MEGLGMRITLPSPLTPLTEFRVKTKEGTEIRLEEDNEVNETRIIVADECVWSEIWEREEI